MRNNYTTRKTFPKRGTSRSNASKRLKRAKNALTRDLWARYGLTKPAKPRFNGYPGILWYVLSRYVRKSEFQKYDGYCVDQCGRRVADWRDADCGHFRASSRGFCTRFQRKNLGLQTKYCNNPKWNPDSAGGFALEIDKRYGPGTAQSLVVQSNRICKEFSPGQYDVEIRKYIDLFNKLPE